MKFGFTYLPNNVRFLDVRTVDKEELKKYILEKKRDRLIKGFNFTLDDLVLVRSINEENFPRSGEYYPLNIKNAYSKTHNPFDYYLLLSTHKHDIYMTEKTSIVHPIYRDTKHFCINGLSSSVKNSVIFTCFDRRPIIIIEPAKEKLLNGKLVNLNPVDTFFDLHDSSMQISTDATILIESDTYENMIKDVEIRDRLLKYNIVIFKGEPAVATDIVLLTLGILPQHQKNQMVLITEEQNNLTDELYLKVFQDYIEKLSMELLEKSYLKVDENLINDRIRNFGYSFPGLLHVDTKYYDEEVEKTKVYLSEAYREYIMFLMELNKRYKRHTENICKAIDNEIKTRFPDYHLSFDELHFDYGNVMSSMLKRMGTNEFIKATDDFNKLQLSKIDKRYIN